MKILHNTNYRPGLGIDSYMFTDDISRNIEPNLLRQRLVDNNTVGTVFRCNITASNQAYFIKRNKLPITRLDRRRDFLSIEFKVRLPLCKTHGRHSLLTDFIETGDIAKTFDERLYFGYSTAPVRPECDHTGCREPAIFLSYKIHLAAYDQCCD